MSDDWDKPRQYPPIDETEDDLCRALWLAVALQALTDAVHLSTSSGGLKDQANALRWLKCRGKGAADFEMVAALSGVDPRRLRCRFEEMLACKQSVSLRTIRKEWLHNRGRESRSKFLKRARLNSSAKREPSKNTSTNQRRKNNV